MANTKLRDINGDEIHTEDAVLFKGEVFNVITNDFNGNFVIDNIYGQTELRGINEECKILDPNEVFRNFSVEY